MPLVVRVLQHDFPIERQYHEGHTLTAGEAMAMNQLLVENIRNNVYGWVVREARGSSILTSEQHADLTARISSYANKYQFKARPRYVPPSPLEAAIRELARLHAETWGNQNGHDPNSSEVYNRYVELRTDPVIQNEARQLVLRRESIANTALVGII